MNAMPFGVSENQTVTSNDKSDSWSVRHSVAVLWRRWRVVLGSALICLALAVLYLAVTPDRFTATAVLVTETKLSPPSPSQLSQEPLIDPAVVESQIELLKSERIAAKVVSVLRLDADPLFAGGAPDFRTRVTAWLMGRAVPSQTRETLRAGAVGTLVRNVKVTRIGHSYLAEIASTTPNPVRSAQVANAIADAYIQDQLDSRLKSNQRNVAWMNQRVNDVKAQAFAAAAAAEQYRISNAAGIAAQDPAAATKLRELSAAAEATRVDHEALENRSSRLAQFIQQQSLPITEARVLTYAEPPLAKSAPKVSVIILLAGFGGLVAGVGAALARETLDRKLRRPEQITSIMRLPFAGTLPAVKSREQVGVERALVDLFDARRPWCTATETLRSIKMAVDDAGRRPAGTVVGMVSAWPGEGKSTMTLNMARMLTETGAKVLAIDADLKKPDLSNALVSTFEFGLTDLADGYEVGSCVVSTGAGFNLLGPGKEEAPLHPFGVLGSLRMMGALAEARQSYDYVLIDFPALLTSIDSQATARFVDAFVFVAEFGGTKMEDVERALATSRTISDKIVGVVLNKARGGDRTPQRRALRRIRNSHSAIQA